MISMDKTRSLGKIYKCPIIGSHNFLSNLRRLTLCSGHLYKGPVLEISEQDLELFIFLNFCVFVLEHLC